MIAIIKGQAMIRRILLVLAAIVSSSTSQGNWTNPVTTMRTSLVNQQEKGNHLYFLNFQPDGKLISPTEVQRAIQDLASEATWDRLLIVSLGWNNEPAPLYQKYLDLIDGLDNYIPRGQKTMILCVSWSSEQQGFRRFFTDLIPFPFIAKTLAFLPDKLLFPFSFWSKAALSTRIGYKGLRSAIMEIVSSLPDGELPPVFLVGHSFGCRVLDTLRRELASLPIHTIGVNSLLLTLEISYLLNYKYITMNSDTYTRVSFWEMPVRKYCNRSHTTNLLKIYCLFFLAYFEA